MGSRSLLVGMEVPILGSDFVKWFEVSVPFPSPRLSAAANGSPSAQPPPPPSADAASCAIIGDPPHYLIWRIHKDRPNALEINELYGYKEFPKIGLRIIFHDVLYPFALICKDETGCASRNPYLVYALTISGVAYLLKLKEIHSYATCSVFPLNEIVELDIQNYLHHGAITAVAAAAGCLVTGRNDGSVGCFQLGKLDPSAPGFLYELRDDAGLGRLWGLMSRRSIYPVQALVVSEVHGKKLIFVLHSDGTLRVWDFLSRSRIFSNTLSLSTSTGATFVSLWVGEANNDTSVIPLAILCKPSLEFSNGIISVYGLRYCLGERVILLLDSSKQDIPLEEGAPIDVKLTSSKIWILKEGGLIAHEYFNAPDNGEGAHCFSLQEAYVADQLFQSSEHSSDDLLCLAQSIFSSAKDQIIPFISSIFLRRLLLPGVHHSRVLQVTFQDYNKLLTDPEFFSLTVDRLKSEILSLVEHEGVSQSPVSVLYWWKTFSARYSRHWSEINAPFSLIIDSTRGTVGLIRKSSISLFRHLEDIEFLIYGSSDQIGDNVTSGLVFSDVDLDREILFEVLHCVSNVSQQLGKASSAIFYESLLCLPSISYEEVLPHLLKVLEIGRCSSDTTLHIAELGADVALEKELSEHKNLRKFSVEMFLSLHALFNKATSWGKVLDIIESYLKFLVPRKIVKKFDSEVGFNMNNSAMVQATSQVAKVMFESALDVLMLLSYLVNIGGQIHILDHDISRIQLELVPMVQENMTEWHIIHFLGTTTSESPASEDFSAQLSSLQIDNNIDRKSWNEKLGKWDFTLACILSLNTQSSFGDQSCLLVKCLPDPANIINSVQEFTSWIMWGRTGKETSTFFGHSTELALILLKHGQYNAVEFLLTTVDAHSRKEKISGSIQSDDGEWGILLHILGCCILAQVQRGLQGSQKEKKVSEAARCFFRASSVQGAPQALQSLSNEAGLPHLGFTGCLLAATWKLHYYQWAMQIFEQHNLSEGACQFALAALEEVDEALGPRNGNHTENNVDESATTVKGRLWANVFKFMLDLNYYYDAYCAIISNPDEESKYLCLRRFIIVLYERGAVKILCDGQIPFIGLAEKVEQELAWKAARSDVSAMPNPFKLLYAFEMYRHNWRKASTYIYLYSAQLKSEAALKDQQRRSLILLERLNGLSAAINALHLVHPAYAWISPLLDESLLPKEHYPSKKARLTVHEQPAAGGYAQAERSQCYLDLENIENEFVLTSAEYLLSLANVNWTFTGNEKPPPDAVDRLIQVGLYDMAFTLILRFWRDSELKRELESVFVALSLKCCPNRVGPLSVGNDRRPNGLLLTSSKDEVVIHGSNDLGPPVRQSKGNKQWETLELYLGKYKEFHRRLPVVVAETLLSADPQIELPLWLVQIFKDVRRGSSFGMTGDEVNPASLFCLFVDYGRCAEATTLFLEYTESFASMRPADIIRRKRPSAVWFPYTTVERLWCKLEELIRAGHTVDQCQKLRELLRGALTKHLNLMRVDSDDTQSSAAA